MEVNASSLRRGLTQSCGCLRREVTNQRSSTHGMAGRGRRRAAEYDVWSHMKRRCDDPRDGSWPRYGGRGITVCDRWYSFEAFFADVGPRPTPEHQLDRTDNDGPYAPDNCRWATRVDQANNRCGNRWLTSRGETLTMAEWSRRTGLKPSTIHQRIKSGWSVEDALRTPLLRRSTTG